MIKSTKITLLLEKLGKKLKLTRINANLTQSQLGDRIGKSRTAIERAERGKCNLDTFVRILVALNVAEQLDLFLPEPAPSPVLLAKAKGKQRKRASSRKNNKIDEDNLEW